MAPALIPSYNKDLNITPFGEKRLIESFYFFTAEVGLLRLMSTLSVLVSFSTTWMCINWDVPPTTFF